MHYIALSVFPACYAEGPPLLLLPRAPSLLEGYRCDVIRSATHLLLNFFG